MLSRPGTVLPAASVTEVALACEELARASKRASPAKEARGRLDRSHAEGVLCTCCTVLVPLSYVQLIYIRENVYLTIHFDWMF